VTKTLRINHNLRMVLVAGTYLGAIGSRRDHRLRERAGAPEQVCYPPISD